MLVPNGLRVSRRPECITSIDRESIMMAARSQTGIDPAGRLHTLVGRNLLTYQREYKEPSRGTRSRDSKSIHRNTGAAVDGASAASIGQQDDARLEWSGFDKFEITNVNAVGE